MKRSCRYWCRADRSHYKSTAKKRALAKARQSRIGKENVLPSTSTASPLSTSTATYQAPLSASDNLGSSVDRPLVDQPIADLSTSFDSLESALDSSSSSEQTSSYFDASGIFDLDKLKHGMEMLSSHSSECNGKCTVEVEETVRSGLSIVLHATCNKCNVHFRMPSSDKVSTSDGKKRWAVNIAAVLSQIATGGGLSRLNSTLAFLGIKGFQKRMYTTVESLLGDDMKQQLVAAMIEAGKVEKQHAVDQKSYHRGIPAVSVVVDGGWSKRTHKHSYNAKSGVAVIFGCHTKQLLFLGVRNKFCSVCTVAKNKREDPPTHKCYRNWDGSSSAMESDILVEGFRISEQLHGVYYMRVIGDGDSSLMANIQQYVIYGPFVEKIECANHACKCYRNRLEELAKDHPEFRGRGRLTKKAIQRLTTGARIAIKMHSKTGDVEQLRKDLRNGPAHVFGEHRHCNPQFCKYVGGEEQHESGHEESDSCQDNGEDFDSLCEQIESIIATESSDAISSLDEEEARRGYITSVESLPPGLYNKILACGDRLVSLASKLILNQTSNLAECYMSIRCCFDGGKQYNRIQSGSFERRCYAAGLRVQNGPQWSAQVWKDSVSLEPSKVLTNALEKQKVKLDKDRLRKSSDPKEKCIQILQ